MKRRVEFILGFIGGILGALAAFVGIMIAALDAVTNEKGTSTFMSHGWSAFAFSMVAIGGALLIQKRPKLAGFMLIIAAIGGFLSVSLIFLLPAIVLLIASLMLLFRKHDSN